MARSTASGFALVLASAILAGTSGAADFDADPVYDRVAQRLALMKPVAAWKLVNGVPVEDLEREAVVQERATADAAATGIAPETAMPFFQAQIEAAKEIQRCWLARWHKGEAPVPEMAPDLVTETRPQLLEIGEALLIEIRTAQENDVTLAEEGDASFAARVDVDCLTPETRDLIRERLAGVRLAN